MWVICALLDYVPDSESGSTDPIESGSNWDPNLRPWIKCFFSFLEKVLFRNNRYLQRHVLFIDLFKKWCVLLLDKQSNLYGPCSSYRISLLAVFRIRDLLVRIRISETPTKNIFKIGFRILLLKVHLNHSSKIKNLKEVRNSTNEVFPTIFTIFAWCWMAKKPSDLDPEHCWCASVSTAHEYVCFCSAASGNACYTGECAWCAASGNVWSSGAFAGPEAEFTVTSTALP